MKIDAAKRSSFFSTQQQHPSIMANSRAQITLLTEPTYVTEHTLSMHTKQTIDTRISSKEASASPQNECPCLHRHLLQRRSSTTFSISISTNSNPLHSPLSCRSNVTDVKRQSTRYMNDVKIEGRTISSSSLWIKGEKKGKGATSPFF